MTSAEIAAVFLLAGASDAVQDELREKDRLLSQLLELQQRVRAGAMPTLEELSVARTTRESILAGIDVQRAAKLGMEPRSVRDRLHPGFHAELEALDKQRQSRDVRPLAEPSPLLTMVLDLEQDLWREADRRRQRIGIKSPLDSGPLSQRLEAQAPANEGATTPTTEGAETAAPANPRGRNLQLLGQAHYRAGRYADALAAWRDLHAPEGAAGLEFEYQRANCLFQVGRTDEAAVIWQKLVDEHAATSWGAQSQFMLKVARAIEAARSAKAAANDGKEKS